MKINAVTFYLTACAALIGGSAQAATQGTAGATSSGSISITLSVAKRVQIGGLSDVTFAAVAPESSAVSAQNVCVWSNTATRGYSVTATGSGPGDAFALAYGGLATPFSVAWNEAAGQSSGMPLNAGAAMSGLTSTATRPDCSSGAAATSSLIVTVAAADLQQAQPETNYTGTLNLLVSPE